MKTKAMIECAVFAAVLCVFCVMTVPIGPVPISMAYFAVMFTAVVLGAKKGAAAVAVYILLGAAGLPVFSGFRSGFGVLLGPTGGYLWAYIIMALFIGAFTRRLPEKRLAAVVKIFCVCVIGIAVGYLAGTVQFMLVQRVGAAEAVTMCVLPFVPFDIAKAAAAAYAGYEIRRRVKV